MARYTHRLRRPKAINRLKTAEVRAFMRSTAWRVTDRGEAAPTAEGGGRRAEGGGRRAKLDKSHYVPVNPRSGSVLG